jgi:hypothetical protein
MVGKVKTDTVQKMQYLINIRNLAPQINCPSAPYRRNKLQKKPIEGLGSMGPKHSVFRLSKGLFLNLGRLAEITLIHCSLSLFPPLISST